MTLMSRIVDQDSDRFMQIGEYLDSAVVPNSVPDLYYHRVKFDDGKIENFLSYQFINVKDES